MQAIYKSRHGKLWLRYIMVLKKIDSTFWEQLPKLDSSEHTYSSDLELLIKAVPIVYVVEIASSVGVIATHRLERIGSVARCIIY